MKSILLILVLSGPIVHLFGQASIKGKVANRQHDLPSVTVLLLNPDSTMVSGVMTDSLGEFLFNEVARGQYLISTTMIGYARFVSQPIIVGDGEKVVPEIILEEKATALNEVLITGERQLFDQKSDRLTINLDNSITSSGNTVLEVLQKLPGIVVNKENSSIIMNGKSGVRIMINDKPMELPRDAVTQMLDGMNASNIERIELIHSPPSRYDAEGNAGIIHIVTKENADLGASGSIGLTLGARWAEGLGGNFNYNRRTKRIAYFLDYAISRNHNLHILKMARESWVNGVLFVVNNDSHRENNTTQQNINAGIEWKSGKNTLFTLLVTGYRRHWKLNAHTTAAGGVAADSTVRTLMNINETNIWQSITGSVGLITKLTSKSEISLSADYLYYHNNNPSNYTNRFFDERNNINAQSDIALRKTTPIRFFVARVDYRYLASSSFTWEAGIKAVTSTLDNDVLTQHNVNDQWITDPVFSSYATLNEDIYAGYVSSRFRSGPGWEINGGIRYEYTRTVMSAPMGKHLVNRKYGYLFPTLSITRKLADEKDFQFSYSRRVTRPTYNDIAPFVFFWGPNTFSSGNTTLYPAIADAITAGYHAKQWNISFQVSHVENEITAWQPETDRDGNLILRSQNLKYLNSLGLTNSLSSDLSPWWKMQTSITVQYLRATSSYLPINVTVHQAGVTINWINSFTLPKGFSMEISGRYQSRMLAGVSQYLEFGSLNAAIQKTLGKHGTLRLAIDDILYTDIWRLETKLPENNLDFYFDYNWHNQFVRVTYTYNFGNTELRSTKLKSGSEEERQRVGN